MSIAVKPTVRLTGLVPQMYWAHCVADQVYAAFGFQLCKITSAVDGKHETGSSHYRGCAIDLETQDPAGSWAMDETTAYKAVAELQSRLGPEFQVIYEQTGPNVTAPHIHCQWKPPEALSP